MKDIIFSPISIVELEKRIKEIIRIELQTLVIPTDAPKTEFISRKATAALLGISLVSLNSYSKRSIIKSYRIGCRVLYKKNEVEESVSLVKTQKYRKGLDQ